MPSTPRDVNVLKARLGSTDFKLAQEVLIPKGTRVVRPLPDKTKVTAMGLDARVVRQLSPAAKKLTKKDLVALWKDRTTPAMGKITLNDLNVIKAGFGAQVGQGPGAVAMDIYCCCCPCCCATAVVEPSAKIA